MLRHLASGAYARVYLAQMVKIEETYLDDDESFEAPSQVKVVLKVDDNNGNACWESYICCELHRHLSETSVAFTKCVVDLQLACFFSNDAISVFPYSPPWHSIRSEQATARDTVALAVSATTSSDVSASSSPQLLVSSSTVPPAASSPATGASNGLPGASPHSTRTSPASSRPPSASPLPAPVPVSVLWSMTGPSAVSSRSQSLPSSSASTPATTKATATVAPLPVAPQQAPASRPGVAQVVSANPSPRTSGASRLIQPKQPQIRSKLSSGSANMTTPSAVATTRSQSPRAAQHKATPRPAPVPAPQPATIVQRGAAMGLNTRSPLLIGNPAAAQPGMFPAGPAHGIFLLNPYIPGLGHSPILIQGTLGQTQSSLGQIQGVQLALRPPHATGLTLGPQTGP
ncbi:hypothetical protein MRX96_013483 [Rhipicephalus microplus]